MEKEFLNVNESMEFMGVSRTQLYKLVEKNNIKWYRLGIKKLALKKSDLISVFKQVP